MIDIREIQRIPAYIMDLMDNYAFDQEFRKNITHQELIQATIIHRQHRNLVKKLKSLHKTIKDFSKGKFEEYESTHNEWTFNEGEPFDPYNWLMFTFFSEDSVDDLPPKIEQYQELLDFSRNQSSVKKGMDSAFTHVFGEMLPFVPCKDKDGNDILMPLEQLPAEEKEKFYIEKQLQQIEADHCLDGYNQFYQDLKEMVRTGRYFKEMLTLFK